MGIDFKTFDYHKFTDEFNNLLSKFIEMPIVKLGDRHFYDEGENSDQHPFPETGLLFLVISKLEELHNAEFVIKKGYCAVFSNGKILSEYEGYSRMTCVRFCIYDLLKLHYGE